MIFLAQQTTTFWEIMVVGKLRVKTRHFHETPTTRIVFLIFFYRTNITYWVANSFLSKLYFLAILLKFFCPPNSSSSFAWSQKFLKIECWIENVELSVWKPEMKKKSETHFPKRKAKGWNYTINLLLGTSSSCIAWFNHNRLLKCITV